MLNFLITITLTPNSFDSYQYFGEKASLKKYSLDEYTCLGAFFPNNKQLLSLTIDDSFTLAYQTNPNGSTRFSVGGMVTDQDDEHRFIRRAELVA